MLVLTPTPRSWIYHVDITHRLFPTKGSGQHNTNKTEGATSTLKSATKEGQ